MLEIKNLSFGYEKNHPVLTDFNLSVGEGEKVGLIGCNGVGKSTLLKLMVELLTPQEGEILLEDVPVTAANRALIRSRIGFVFQDADSQLFMPTVKDDLAFGPRNYGVSEEETAKRIEEIAGKLQIGKLLDKKTTNLSGGEKKLVSLATVLVLNPRLLLLDEPTIALDPGNRRRFIYALRDIATTQILASHDLDLVWDVCDRVILMGPEGIVADDVPEKILRDEEGLKAQGLELPLSLSRRG